MNYNIIQSKIKTHTQRSDDDRSAVSTLNTFLRSDGKIVSDFQCNDKWPNIDGRFELVPNSVLSRKPTQSFFVQIKGTNNPYVTKDGVISYYLDDLCFPAYIFSQITTDPAILFIVVNPSIRGEERVFWKYLSSKFLNDINFEKKGLTIKLYNEDEIFNTDESIDLFVSKLEMISNHHSFVSFLENRRYKIDDINRIIDYTNKDICDCIDYSEILNENRDSLSRKLLTKLEDLCNATLLLNAVKEKYENPNTRLAWELSLMKKDTIFLSYFLQSIKYLRRRIPEKGQSERLMLKYYDYLWSIRNYLKNFFNKSVLQNLEKFPLNLDKEDKDYYSKVSQAIEQVKIEDNYISSTRYYIENKKPFYYNGQRYYEITLQLSNKYASKFNRIVVYTKLDITTSYTLQIHYKEVSINIWDDIETKIKIVNDWKVNIDPSILNSFSKILNFTNNISSNYKEYKLLMSYLTDTGINLVDLIDLTDNTFYNILNSIYGNATTIYFKNILVYLKQNYNIYSEKYGKNTIRFILLNLSEEKIEIVYENSLKDDKNNIKQLGAKFYPFEKNPILYNYPTKKTIRKIMSEEIIRIVNQNTKNNMLPYVRLKNFTDINGHVYIPKKMICQNDNSFTEYNNYIHEYDKQMGFSIKETEDNYVYIQNYEDNTLHVLKTLQDLTKSGNIGQQKLNNYFIEKNEDVLEDPIKKLALHNVFVSSKLIMIYGPAGTGKTTLINFISQLMDGRKKIFLAKTHTAVKNLQEKVKNAAYNCKFDSIDAYLNRKNKIIYDIVFVDECSVIDNYTMKKLLNTIGNDVLLVCAGDIYQIESIEFGNWFTYAKNIVSSKSIVELTNNWRTEEENLKSLWDEVRNNGHLITEKLVIDGPFSREISSSLFKKNEEDEIVLCLNYDGRLGLNNINSYFQDSSFEKEYYIWDEWKYKIGDPILFNESQRFPALYNNLKGKIVNIKEGHDSLEFTISIDLLLTNIDVKNNDLEILYDLSSDNSKSTIVKFSVYKYNGGVTEEERNEAKIKSIVPFQVAYAVTIHKSQGLEFDSVKIVIPKNNSGYISKGIFYTAITRAKKRLRIYWTTETMKSVIESFKVIDYDEYNLHLLKKKLSL